MGSFSIWHWMIVLVVVLLLFGRGKIPELMGDMAKGIKSFKKGMAEDETPQASQTVTPPSEPVRTIPHAAETSPGTAIPASHLPANTRVPPEAISSSRCLDASLWCSKYHPVARSMVLLAQ